MINLLKTNNWWLENFNITSMNCSLSPQYSHVILVGGYPVLQLSIDHNTDVQYQVKHRLYMYLQASVPYPIHLHERKNIWMY